MTQQPVSSSPRVASLLLAALALLTASSLRAQTPATPAQYTKWRTQIRQALFIPATLPSVEPQSFGTFSPTPGVIAERVTYATLYGMRVPAIVYRPEKPSGKSAPA
ncbi:hypothetical protein [Granulicella tundricola]|uniref:hypothetical protein n=1 Tax=Granulicella tundricola TaxID=940615 RepID=UPI0001DB7987|nr:hypothetical protein [Granulicella tundricola]